MRLFILCLLALLCFYAIVKEKEQKNAYLSAVYEKTDTKDILFSKILASIESYKKTVKWRRSLITSCIFLCCYMILFGLQEYSKMFLIVLLFYVVYYMAWQNYDECFSKKVEKNGKQLVKKLKTC